MADRELPLQDLLGFMDDDERARWDSGTEETHAKLREELTTLWFSIPDPTDDDLKPPYTHPTNWAARDRNPDVRRATTREWKKARKAKAREEQTSSPKNSQANPTQDSEEKGSNPETKQVGYRYIEISSPEELVLRKREKLVQREEALQRQREMEEVYKLRSASLWPGVDEQHARRMQAAFEGKPNPDLPKPWHKHRDLVVGILLACGAAIMTIALLLLPVDNKARVVLLIFMFVLLAFSIALILHYFDRLRLGVALGIMISAITTSAFGWYVWPKPPPPPPNALCRATTKSEIVGRLYGDTITIPPANGEATANFNYMELFYEWSTTVAPECNVNEAMITINYLRSGDRVQTTPPDAIVSDPKPQWASGFDEPARKPDWYSRTIKFTNLTKDRTAHIAVRRPINAYARNRWTLEWPEMIKIIDHYNVEVEQPDATREAARLNKQLAGLASWDGGNGTHKPIALRDDPGIAPNRTKAITTAEARCTNDICDHYSVGQFEVKYGGAPVRKHP